MLTDYERLRILMMAAALPPDVACCERDAAIRALSVEVPELARRNARNAADYALIVEAEKAMRQMRAIGQSAAAIAKKPRQAKAVAR